MMYFAERGFPMRELALRLRLGQALHRLGAQFLDRAQEALAYFFGLQQRERRAQRLGIIGADRTDQDFTAIGQADLLVPRGKEIAGAHAGQIASMTLKNPRRREERVRSEEHPSELQSLMR